MNLFFLQSPVSSTLVEQGITEIVGRQPPNDFDATARWIRSRCARFLEEDRMNLRGCDNPVYRHRHVEHDTQSQWATEVESVPSGEIAQGIGNQAPAVNLHATQDVGSVAEGEIGSGIDHGP